MSCQTTPYNHQSRIGWNAVGDWNNDSVGVKQPGTSAGKALYAPVEKEVTADAQRRPVARLSFDLNGQSRRSSTESKGARSDGTILPVVITPR